MRTMIGITISGEAYAAIARTIPGAEAADQIAPNREYRVWMPRDVVIRLSALRELGETFSDVILRLAARGSYAAITR